MLHVPLLRAGRPYRSLEVVELPDVRSGMPVARVSRANPGLIARDLVAAADHRGKLRREGVSSLLAICRRGAALFAEADLAVDPVDGVSHSPEAHVRALSATTGLPQALCRANMEKIRFVLAEMDTVLAGLTRGLDLDVLDGGLASGNGRSISYRAETDALGVVLPSNSPGVHSLWLPSIALGFPLALKPGGLEPWTPMRVAQALMRAGCPPEAFGFYPSDHSGGAEILLRAGRSMLFGDDATVRPWAEDPRVQIHGPGRSKVLFGADAIDTWTSHLDLIVASIAENGGRSCLNASGVWVPARGREVAEALAERLARVEARRLDDPAAAIAAFPDPAAARRVSSLIDRQLRIPGAEDVTARHRPGGRVVEVDGCTFLLPTIVRCWDPGHPLAAAEFLFPFAAVVEVEPERMLERIGPTLVATAITEDPRWRAELLATRAIDRLNLGPIPTSRIAWDQPHEGNLFEHLYRRRALQTAV
jgi:acyl-CoA reductase-like NAD-dependent aldehyde dehydrogenase